MSAVESPAPPAGGLDSGGLVPSNDRMARHRADAQQNRTQLLDAAEAAFVEMGLNAPLDLIAQRAGVARITLFRNFADRQALIMALLQRGLQEVEAEATRVADQDDGFLILLRFVASPRLRTRWRARRVWRPRPAKPKPSARPRTKPYSTPATATARATPPTWRSLTPNVACSARNL
ncbi:TetR/AcrR family transcriptional regulator [Brevundimonas sp. C43]|uniref:TetR/AcrR family transcriptional regulator n=1 Tax=Brevundimonas sp. C43 TaxID=3068314 RepID=UPI00273EE310|nr:TetR/AcrR family transcriptional regulator [Brevundimonas sp. C43]